MTRTPVSCSPSVSSTSSRTGRRICARASRPSTPARAPENVTVANGGAEANFIAAWRVVEPGDHVVMVLPNYMQLWGVLRSFGANVVGVPLREEAGWTPDPDELRRAVTAAHAAGGGLQPQQPDGRGPSRRSPRGHRGCGGPARRLGPGRRGLPRCRARRRGDRDLLGQLRADAGDGRAEQGLRPARLAAGLGGGAGRVVRGAVGAQGLPDHQPRRALRPAGPRARSIPRAPAHPGPYARDPDRELPGAGGLGRAPPRRPAPGPARGRAPSPTCATPGP